MFTLLISAIVVPAMQGDNRVRVLTKEDSLELLARYGVSSSTADNRTNDSIVQLCSKQFSSECEALAKTYKEFENYARGRQEYENIESMLSNAKTQVAKEILQQKKAECLKEYPHAKCSSYKQSLGKAQQTELNTTIKTLLSQIPLEGLNRASENIAHILEQ